MVAIFILNEFLLFTCILKCYDVIQCFQILYECSCSNLLRYHIVKFIQYLNLVLFNSILIPVMAEEIEKGDDILDIFLARKEVRELSDDTDEVMEELGACKCILKVVLQGRLYMNSNQTSSTSILIQPFKKEKLYVAIFSP